MDLIYTDENAVDQGVLNAYDFDLSYGADENDFELVLDVNDAALKFGSSIYMEGTEYGGVVSGVKTATNSENITYTGRTWHGILNSKIIEPDAGQAYLTVSGEANAVLASLIARMGLNSLFKASSVASGIMIANYKMNRYVKGYDGICAMLSDYGAKLKIEVEHGMVILAAVPIADYTEAPLDGDVATLSVERYSRKVNHLICLGKGELTDREIIHLYIDANGEISDNQHYAGFDEVADTYENPNTEDLHGDGVKRLKSLRNIDKAEIDLTETDGRVYDIGDIVGASEYKSGISVTATVTQKIVNISNGAVSIEYKTGS